jgi:hypothetical protein
MRQSLFSSLVMCIALVGCGVGQEPDSYEEAESAVEVSSGELTNALKQVVGKYQGGSASPFVSLELKANSTFVREEKVSCFAAPCAPARVTGSFQIVSSLGTKRLRFRDGGLRILDTYEMRKIGEALNLRKLNTASWFSLQSINPQTVSCGGFAGLSCPAGLSCVIDWNQCQGTADCLGTCRASTPPAPPPPPPTNTVCGGFAGLTCASGQTCIDDPEDDCVPAYGDADCVGKCR